MCVRDGTEICDRPEDHKPCGWCVLAKCPQAMKAQEKAGPDEE